MDHSIPENPSLLPGHQGEEAQAIRAVAFPNEPDSHEEKNAITVRTRGVEMKRNLTQEDRELAAAGYEHLEAEKIGKAVQDSNINAVDIEEHHLPFSRLEEALATSVDTKDPGQSHGLTSAEAQARLDKNGPNVLTPPVKKSALRKVHFTS